MQRPMYQALNREIKWSQFKRLGVYFGGVGAVIAMIKVGFLYGLIGAAPAYLLGSIISEHLHKGRAQREIYWHLPVAKIYGGRFVPPSWQRKFF